MGYGVSDPRKIILSAKIGLALTIVAILLFFQEPNPDLSRYSVWAILTAVVFEFTIGQFIEVAVSRSGIPHHTGGPRHHPSSTIQSQNAFRHVQEEPKSFSSFREWLHHLQVLEYRGEQVRGIIADLREARYHREEQDC